MVWRNLQQNKCPKCSEPFGNMAFTKPGYVRCYKCGFCISENKYSFIVRSQITEELERKWSNEMNQEEIIEP